MLSEVVSSGADPESVAAERGFEVLGADELGRVLDEVIQANPDEWSRFVEGDEKARGKLTGFFVGQVMKATQGQADGKAVTSELLARRLMAFEVRQPSEAELPEYFRTISIGFGNTRRIEDEAYQAAEAAIWELDRTFGAFDGDLVVGGTSAYSFQMALPGGLTAPTAGVTGVAVLPTHRRRGILAQLMSDQLDEIVQRGDVFAALNASESQIYGRFGYGAADEAVSFELATDRSRLARLPETGRKDPARGLRGGSRADPAGLRGQPADTTGEMERSPDWWRIVLGPVEGWKGGGDQFFAVLEGDTGEPSGVRPLPGLGGLEDGRAPRGHDHRS